MPEWLVERGIGETRATLVQDGQIIEARIEPDGAVPAGSVVAARLIQAAARNAIACDETGTEYLLPKGALGVTEGAALTIEVTRDAIPGSEPWKRPLARVTGKSPHAAPPLAESLAGRTIAFPAPEDHFGRVGWDDVIEQARTGLVAFPGGELHISPTPAMTLIDVDGYLPPEELAVRGSAEAAKAIRRLDIGGSVGIDLPTAGSKAARQRSAAAIDAELPQPFECTAVNGFGFIQLVRPRQRASLIELAQDSAPFEARTLLRRAAFESPGPKQLVAHPAVIALLRNRANWLNELSRQIGGAVSLRTDLNLPMSGGYADKV